MRIAAIEYQLGSQVETLEDLGAINADWRIERLRAKTGIDQHHLSADDESAFTLALSAGQRLLNGHGRDDIGGLVYVTQSPESTIPTTACLLHEELGLPAECFAFDLNQGCSGFIYGLSVAGGLMTSAGIDRGLVVCAETYTKYIAPDDRTCRPIFSDGASAVLVEANDDGRFGPFVFVTDGSGAPNLTLHRNPEGGNGPSLYMNGPKVLQFTMEAVPASVRKLLARAELGLGDIDLFVFHQASKVVLDRIQSALGIDDRRLFRNYKDMGNTVSATIPVALKQATESGQLHDGMTVLLMGFGVGYSLAGCILRT